MTEINSTLTCVVCQAEYLPRLNKDGSPRKTKYFACSAACSSRASCIAKNVGGEDPNGLVRSSLSWKAIVACLCCGKEFRRKKSDQEFCSKGCYLSARKPKARPHTVACERCGKEKATLQKSARFCGRRCANTAYKHTNDPLIGRRYEIAKAATAARKADARRTKDISKKLLKDKRIESQRLESLRACRHCGVEYCALSGRLMAFCGDDCAWLEAKERKKAARQARKALERAALVESVRPLSVLRRDEWRCYLCDCETPASLRGTYEDNAPELDHVVPLSRGGEHSYANLRCACRKCNLIKSDLMLEEIGGEFLEARGRGSDNSMGCVF